MRRADVTKNVPFKMDTQAVTVGDIWKCGILIQVVGLMAWWCFELSEVAVRVHIRALAHQLHGLQGAAATQ